MLEFGIALESERLGEPDDGGGRSAGAAGQLFGGEECGFVEVVDYVPGDILLPVSYTHLDVYKRQVELDAPFVSEGQTAEVTLDALPGETLRGTVIDIGRAPETARGDVVYRVRVALDDTELPLRWGMTAVVRMTNDE